MVCGVGRFPCRFTPLFAHNNRSLPVPYPKPLRQFCIFAVELNKTKK